MWSPASRLGTLLADATMYARFGWGLRGFLRETISAEQARSLALLRLEQREESFLRVVERGIFGHPRSPYLPLLELAGCELGDLRRMVRDRGLEPTLLALREAGVYVGFEEFKGRVPIVRDGREIPLDARAFDNPYARRAYEGSTGGSTGAGTRIDIDLDYLALMASHVALVFAIQGFYGVPNALWCGTPPDSSGLMVVLTRSHFAMPPARWFAFPTDRGLKRALRHRLAVPWTTVIARASGVRLPSPRPLPFDRAEVAARWMAAALRSHGACVLSGNVGMAVRISAAARREGIDLRGAAFFGGGEPPTPAKVRTVEASGARWIPLYGSQEAGHIGLACAQPSDGNDLHVARDTLGVVQHPRLVPGTNVTVPAFNITGLAPSFPRIMLNVELDDFGVLESRSCGCPLEALGFADHVREIYSFRKLTGEGVTLVGSEMIPILEELLPSRFGGGPLDYQLLEEEGQDGLTQLSLLVSPRVPLVDEQAVVQAVLDALGRSSASADVARAIWSQAGSLRVQRREPILTERGKLLTLRLGQRPSSTASSADV